jgi:hypothetical protein
VTGTNGWGKAVPKAGLIQVTVHASIRDESGCLMRPDEQRRFVGDKQHLRDAVLGYLQQYWPEAKHDDVDWDVNPDAWDGVGEIWWTTCAEVDGFVRYIGREQFN